MCFIITYDLFYLFRLIWAINKEDQMQCHMHENIETYVQGSESGLFWNIEELFYLTSVSHTVPLIRRAYGRMSEWSTTSR